MALLTPFVASSVEIADKLQDSIRFHAKRTIRQPITFRQTKLY